MALSKELEDELTCPIHLEYYENPKQLKCLHVLCEKDVAEMTDENGVLKADKKRLQDKLLCEYCQLEPASSKCQECCMYFGENCQRGHLKAPISRAHTFVSLNDIKKAQTRKVQSAMDQIGATIDSYHNTQLGWESRKSELEQETLKSHAFITKSETQVMAEVKRIHDELRQELGTETENKMQSCDNRIQGLQTEIDSSNRSNNLLKNILNEPDSTKLLNAPLVNEIIDLFKNKACFFKEYITSIIPESSFVNKSTEKLNRINMQLLQSLTFKTEITADDISDHACNFPQADQGPTDGGPMLTKPKQTAKFGCSTTNPNPTPAFGGFSFPQPQPSTTKPTQPSAFEGFSFTKTQSSTTKLTQTFEGFSFPKTQASTTKPNQPSAFEGFSFPKTQASTTNPTQTFAFEGFSFPKTQASTTKPN